MAIKRDDFPLPDVDDPLTAPFFAGAARGELLIPRCDACGEYVWYPQADVPGVRRRARRGRAVSGRGTLFSWAVVRRAFLPAFAEHGAVRHRAGRARRGSRRCGSSTYIVDAEPDDARRRRSRCAVEFRPLAFPTVPGKSVVVPMFDATRAMIYDGLRVVDCTDGIAGAYCAKLLTDLGADVVFTARRSATIRCSPTCARRSATRADLDAVARARPTS